MIIKSMARKEASFGQLVAYMEKDGGDGDRVLYHNFYGHDRMRREEIVREFEENARRLPRRKNGNALYHEILSLDAGHSLTRDEARRILADIGHEYLSRRAPEQLAYGALHRDTGHLHLHLCISSNPFGKANRARLEKKRFAEIQKEVEAIVLERYPELNQGIVYAKDRAREKVKTASREQAYKERTGKDSRKEAVAGRIHGLLEFARDRRELDALLERDGFRIYERGKTLGIEDAEGKRHRLKTLGLDLHFSAALERFAAPKDRADRDPATGSGTRGAERQSAPGAPPGSDGRAERRAAPEPGPKGPEAPPPPEKGGSAADRRKAELDRAFAASREREERERKR